MLRPLQNFFVNVNCEVKIRKNADFSKFRFISKNEDDIKTEIILHLFRMPSHIFFDPSYCRKIV